MAIGWRLAVAREETLSRRDMNLPPSCLKANRLFSLSILFERRQLQDGDSFGTLSRAASIFTR